MRSRKQAAGSDEAKTGDPFTGLGLTPSGPPPRHIGVRTNVPRVDYDILTIGGFPTRNPIQIWGPERSGKTTFMLYLAAQARKQHPDKTVIWVDTEQKLDVDYAAGIGLDFHDSKVRRHIATTLEETWDYLISYFKNKDAASAVSAVFVDSLGAVAPAAYLEDSALAISANGTRKGGQMARVAQGCQIGVTAALRALTDSDVDGPGPCIFIGNQVRANITPTVSRSTISKYVYPGGYGLSHRFAMSLFMSHSARNSEMLGHHTTNLHFDLHRSSYGPGGKTKYAGDDYKEDLSALHIAWKDGLDCTEMLGEVMYAYHHGMTRSGSVYTCPAVPDLKIVGRKALMDMLQENVDVRRAIVAYARNSERSHAPDDVDDE